MVPNPNRSAAGCEHKSGSRLPHSKAIGLMPETPQKMSIEQPSPYEFELSSAKPPASGTWLKFQCLTLLFLLTTELAVIWLRPIIVTYSLQLAAANQVWLNSIGSRNREQIVEQNNKFNQLMVRTTCASVIALGCIGLQLLGYIPFVASCFWTTTRKALSFRYLALLATSVPLAIGVYYQDLIGISPFLALFCKMAYQYMVIAFAGYVLVLNCLNDRQKPIAILSIVPVALVVISVVQDWSRSIPAMYLLASFATILMVSSVRLYFRLCFRPRSDTWRQA